uniref:Protein TIC 20 n=1 Tax=Hemiselmis andersenii TaxID=464988 RepID=A0A7S1GTJ9_HEMAN|mmetsp:Transcript_1573/g.3813  ORF Transcript_1573/g.3813 Transcript_1573/m.3813 type:complete len:243 (+) Transcript_1573:59-787(+)
MNRVSIVAAVAVMGLTPSLGFSVGPAFAPRLSPSALTSISPHSSPLALRSTGPASLAQAQLNRRSLSRRTPAATGMQMNFLVEGLLRIGSCMPYILPMMDSLAYGRFIFQKVPLISMIFMTPLQPFVELAQAFPMLSFVAFLGLFLFVVRNKKIPRFVRFNTMQALLLEIILIFPQILTSSNMGGLIPFMFTEFISNMTFYSVVAIVVYSCLCNLRGELPCKIPVISTAVFQQIGGGAGYED